MKLDTLDWATITRAQAKRLRVAAAARERAVTARFERGEASVDEYRSAMKLEEDLHVYAVCGAKPGTY
jgi:hypothetical protein